REKPAATKLSSSGWAKIKRRRGVMSLSSRQFPSEFVRTEYFGLVDQCYEAARIGILLVQRAKKPEQSFTRGAALGHIRRASGPTDESVEIETLEIGEAPSFGR